ncbi:MAG: insulinase family protein [Candidatus Nomurabacteria bacterium]|jgi:predicted Zn-dependent peptidase|nr:insulinase family protein [Candidatus Nomurabacteria bacterium]
MKHSVEKVELDNGAKGLLIDVPSATVMSFDFEFRAGYRFTKSEKLYEVSHLMEHMAFGANARFQDGLAYETEFTKNGAYHNASTSDYLVGYDAECADFEWERILDLQLLSITSPRFNQKEMDAERGNVKNELTGLQNSYPRILWQKLYQACGVPCLLDTERTKLLPNIKLEDIKEHYRRTHVAKNMRFLIAGDLRERKEKIKRILNEADFKKGQKWEFGDYTMHKVKPLFIKRKDAVNLTFGFGFTLPKRLSDEEVDAMDCLNHILTGTLSSRILGRARNEGLIYGMYSEATRGLFNSSWEFSGAVNVETARDLFRIIKEELSKVLAGEVSENDLENAKSYALGRHQMRMQTARATLNFYFDQFCFLDEVEDFASVPDRIKSVNRTKIIETAREFVERDVSVFGMVGRDNAELAKTLGAALTELK